MCIDVTEYIWENVGLGTASGAGIDEANTHGSDIFNIGTTVVIYVTGCPCVCPQRRELRTSAFPQCNRFTPNSYYHTYPAGKMGEPDGNRLLRTYNEIDAALKRAAQAAGGRGGSGADEVAKLQAALPKIVVIGSQSAGKSSVLNRLSGSNAKLLVRILFFIIIVISSQCMLIFGGNIHTSAIPTWEHPNYVSICCILPLESLL